LLRNTAAAILCGILLAPPVIAQEMRRAAPQRDHFYPQDVRDVLRTAYSGILERQLDIASPAELLLWALRGLTALDTAFTIQVVGGTLQLGRGSVVLLSRSLSDLPAAASAQQDNLTIADLIARSLVEFYVAAWNSSAAIQAGGAERLLQSGFEEVFNHLDPYSRYVPSAEAQQLRHRRSGQTPLGFRMAAGARNTIVVVSVFPGGPAQQAGLREGDSVLAIDGQAVTAARIALAAELLEGSTDGNIKLTVRRAGRRLTLSLSRSNQRGSSLLAELHENILWLRLTVFSTDTGLKVAEALDRAFSAGVPPTGIVLDLRGNRGGLLQQAMSVSDAFLSRGVIAQSQGRHPGAQRIWHAAGGDLARGRPVVALVDGRTASAAEIVVAALSDQGRAVVVGSSSLGKGLIQIVLPLPNDAEMLISWARVLAPRGWPVQGLGVLPALCTSLGQETLERDLQQIGQGVAPMAGALARLRSLRAPVPASEVLALRGTCPPAEGREQDLLVARFLLDHPAAYEALLAR
jgi:carboxyl-terminal processing protease